MIKRVMIKICPKCGKKAYIDHRQEQRYWYCADQNCLSPISGWNDEPNANPDYKKLHGMS